MIWLQRTVHLQARPRGFHLVTDELVSGWPELDEIRIGLFHAFVQHTSASLFLNENADPTVRGDFERHFNRLCPDGAPYYQHRDEGPDDMAAHLKAALLGHGVHVPVHNGRLALGTWQGIYLGEHRDNGGARRIIVTVSGCR